MTSLSERAAGQPDRAATLGARISERPRDLQKVSLVMVDGAEIRGSLHCAPGMRTLDYMNRQTEPFVAMTAATVTHGQRSERFEFIAVNKVHIIRVIETADAD